MSSVECLCGAAEYTLDGEANHIPMLRCSGAIVSNCVQWNNYAVQTTNVVIRRDKGAGWYHAEAREPQGMLGLQLVC